MKSLPDEISNAQKLEVLTLAGVDLTEVQPGRQPCHDYNSKQPKRPRCPYTQTAKKNVGLRFGGFVREGAVGWHGSVGVWFAGFGYLKNLKELTFEAGSIVNVPPEIVMSGDISVINSEYVMCDN